VNPLRPYYVPPSIGSSVDATPHASANGTKPAGGRTFSFPDLDDFIPDGTPSLAGSVKSYLDQGLWRYSSVLIAQPFEVAKVILQTRVAQDGELADGSRSRGESREKSMYQEYEQEESEDEEPNYFTSTAPLESRQFDRSPTRGRRGRPVHESPHSQSQSSAQPKSTVENLHMRNPHSLLDALSALSSSSGTLAMWRATNSTFIYNILSRTVETFFRGLLGAVFGVAEADVLVPMASGAIPDSAVLSSTSPAATILIATAAATISALLLAPIDAARTRLILTPSSHEPRTLLGTLRTLSPAWIIPTHLIPITLFNSSIPTLISSSTPIFLKSYLNLDPAMNPTPWSIATFLGSAIDLSIKFPLETVLRRAQIVTWTSPSSSPPASSSKRKAIQTIVPVPQAYRGILPTIWGIMREEGYSESQKDRTAALMGKAPRRKRKGQGVEGLYRGWRVGLWGLVGVWGTAFVSGLQNGAEGAPADTPNVHGGKF